MSTRDDLPSRRTQADRRAATRTALLDAARELFVTLGHAEAGTPQIVAAAGVTRGALYHHFADKNALFRAVCEREAEAISRAIDEATRATDDPREAMKLGTSAYFDAMSVPGRARLLLLEAPAALGHEAAVALTRTQGGAELRAGLAHALPAASAAELDALADILSAAFDRAALAIASGGDRTTYSAAMLELIDRSIAVTS